MKLSEERDQLEAEREELRLLREADQLEREGQLIEREDDLEMMTLDATLREEELLEREQSLSERELAIAGTGELEGWTEEEPEAYQEPVADYSLFHEELADYGNWFQSDNYGYIYQPTIVVQDNSWRPYTRGRWVCSNLGWTWCSDEPFGWACFHYGRWVSIVGRGWCWVPGSEWAPSWVDWRTGGGYVGWAPLPPETLCYRGSGWGLKVGVNFGIGRGCYTYVKNCHIASRPWRHCLPVSRNRYCYDLTRCCTRIRCYGKRVVTGGPRYASLRKEVKGAWPVYKVGLDPVGGFRSQRSRHGYAEGGRLNMFAPGLDVAWNSRLSPEKVAGRIGRAEVVRSESGIEPSLKKRYEGVRAWEQQRGRGSDKLEPVKRSEQLTKNREVIARSQTVERARTVARADSDRSGPTPTTSRASTTGKRPPQIGGEAAAASPRMGQTQRPLETDRKVRTEPGRDRSQVAERTEASGRSLAELNQRNAEERQRLAQIKQARSDGRSRTSPTASTDTVERDQARQARVQGANLKSLSQAPSDLARRLSGRPTREQEAQVLQIEQQRAASQAREQDRVARVEADRTRNATSDRASRVSPQSTRDLQQEKLRRASADRASQLRATQARQSSTDRLREQQEKARQLSESRVRQAQQQEAARRASADRSRQQQEAAQRASAERVRQQQDAARRASADRARQQQEAAQRASAERARQQQDAARRANADRARQAQQQAARASADRARQQQDQARRASAERSRQVQERTQRATQQRSQIQQPSRRSNSRLRR